jgi:putative PIN family toxin of toxin-antitoxin system
MGGRLAWLRSAWQMGRLKPLISQPVARELIHVLEYPKLRLDRGEREIVLGDHLPVCEVVKLPRKKLRLPACRDPADSMFLELAVAGSADFIVTGDRDLLALASSFSVPIVRPEEFHTRIGMPR